VAAGAAARLAGPAAAAVHAAVQATTLLAAATSAAWQARHILAPSVFAPRFVFEAAFCASGAAGGAVAECWLGWRRRRTAGVKRK
jgi:hypothetical protein